MNETVPGSPHESKNLSAFFEITLNENLYLFFQHDYHFSLNHSLSLAKLFIGGSMISRDEE